MSKNTQQKERMSAQNDDVMEDDILLKDITRKAIPKRKRSWTSKAVEISASSPEGKRGKPSKKNQEKELSILKVKEDEGALKKFRTTSRSHSLVMLILNLEDHQKEAIKEIGFGGLLDLKLTSTPSAMITKLIDAFDVTTSTMIISKDKSFRITKDDVRDVFGLPSGPSCVEYLMMGSFSAKSEIKDKWRAMFYASKGIPINKLLQTLKEHKKSDDLFKQMFVLYAMSQFLSPTSNSEADMRLLKAVDVVSEIKNIDWCSHVYSELVAAIKQFKASPPTYLRGCFLFLMVSWFHKFDYREDSLSTELPLIKHWDDVKLTNMITIEVAPGKFGSAPLRKYDEPNLEVHQTTPEKKDLPPVKRYLQIELPNDILTDEEIDAQATNEVHALCLKNNRDTLLYYTRYSERVDLMKSLLNKEHCIAEKAEATTSTSALHLSPTQPILKNPYFIQYLDFLEEKAKLYKRNAQSLPTFEDYCQKNGISVGDSEVGKSTIETMEESVHLENLEEPRASAKEVVKNSVGADNLVLEHGSANQTIVYDNRMVVDGANTSEGDASVEEIQTIVDETRVDLDSDGEDDGLAEQTVVGDQGCTFPQLSIPEIGTIESSAGVVDNAMKEAASNVQEAERMKGVDDYLKLPEEGMLDATAERCLSSIMNIDIPQVVGTSYLLHCEEYEATMSLVPSNLGCSLNCGEVDPSVCVISKTLFEKKERYEKMLSLRKRVVDYCLLNDSTLPEMESLFMYDDTHVLSRENINTMLPNEELDTVLIDCWSTIVNDMNVMNSPNSSKICFGIFYSQYFNNWILCKEGAKKSALQQDIFDVFTSFLNNNVESKRAAWNLGADMVFIPMLTSDHFYAICINFKSRKVEYLDNRSYDTIIDYQTYGMKARALANLFGHYLCKSGVVRGGEVCNFELVNVPFRWQVHHSEAGSTDCGVYLMMHMLFYNGSTFDCDLSNKRARALYRAEIVAIFVLSDLNKIRGDLLASVEAFEERKAALLPGLILRRKEVEEKRLVEKLLGDQASIDPPCETVPLNSPGSSVLGSRKRHLKSSMSDGLGCSIVCASSKSLVLVSKYMKEHKADFIKILFLRKLALDYCFLTDFEVSPTESLVCYGLPHDLTREDLTSLNLDSHMNPAIVDHWAMLLNTLENEQTDKVAAFYFGLTHMEALLLLIEDDSQADPRKDKLFNTFDEWVLKNKCVKSEADLWFIPLLDDDHYLCVCINFINKTIDIIDNQIRSKVNNSGIISITKCLFNCISDYLEYKEDSRADEFMSFKNRTIMYTGQTNPANDAQSGLYLLMNMASYEGSDIYSPTLEFKRTRRTCGAEIVASLILADINEQRLKVLKRLSRVEDNKDSMLEAQKEEKKATKKKPPVETITAKRIVGPPYLARPLRTLPPATITVERVVGPKHKAPQNK